MARGQAVARHSTLSNDELLNQDVKTNALGRRRPGDLAETMGEARAYLRSTQKQPGIVRNYFNGRRVIVIKRSMNPGFAGIDNELYHEPRCSMLFGHAKGAISKLVEAVKAL